MKRLFILVLLYAANSTVMAQLVARTPTGNFFSLTTATIYVDANDYSLVKKSAELLQQDIERVTGKRLPIINDLKKAKGNIIVAGSSHHSLAIKQLIARKKINSHLLANKWEALLQQTITNPFPGVSHALVLTGSDRRGTAYSILDFSKQIGVSPWYWWADVPCETKKEIFLKANIVVTDAPKVKYRGLFINDEAPALSGWSKEKFGGFNHRFYEKVFELVLRLKGNYVWPAMWGNAFYDDDTLNIKTADEYGIVMGTSHHEPLMRAHDEWRRYGKGQKWNYDSTEAALKSFWKTGMQRAWNEKIVSIGMRGDGDEPMSRETATALLERIVKDQREIIEDVTGKPASATPQLWALYKEVQDYYDKGMRVPDDVTLLLCDDNWGNIRKLPRLTDPRRKGGYGIYYHFDYVGGPRNYKWINTNNIARVWEQMHLAYEYNARQIWIVNVGDIKPMELPLCFFLDYAWNPAQWNEDNLENYFYQWAASQFGTSYAAQIGDILRRYSQFSSRRKPELLDAKTYRISDFREDDEAGRVLKDWNDLQRDAEKINTILPEKYKAAFFQLVLHPVKAFANLHRLHIAVANNHRYAAKNSPAANRFAEEAKNYFKQDSLITLEYHQLANGKWNHLMSQTHIGYSSWQQPPFNKMPELNYVTNPEEEPPLSMMALYSAIDSIPENSKGNNFYEQDGAVSIHAANWTRKINSTNIQWKTIPGIGRDGDGITVFPVTAPTQKPVKNGPRLEYDVYVYDTGTIKLNAYFSPSLNFHGSTTGLQYAISVDNETPQRISINSEDKNSISGIWNKWVADNVIIKSSTHRIAKPGKHTVKYWLIHPGVIVQKLVLDFGGVNPGYLGPAETRVNHH